MSSAAKVGQSRQLWKAKAIERGEGERYERKEKKRISKERDRYKQELAIKSEALEDARQKIERFEQKLVSVFTMSQKVNVVYIALMLFCVARISFRAVSRVFEVLKEPLGLKKVPCIQTVINWVTRLSIARMRHVCQVLGKGEAPIGDRFSNGFVWMIDTSIGLSSGKILAVLALDIRHHQLTGKAPTLQDVTCIGVSVSISWTGEAIAAFLKQIITVIGRPLAYLKDGGTDLGKAVKLLAEKGLASYAIDDISHMAANLLKHAYEEHPMFNGFISTCGQASKRLKQTLLACLTPPKVSIKARFMNLHRLVRWAERVLKHSPKGRAARGSILEKLRQSLGALPQYKAFILQFLQDATMLLECQKLLKVHGLKQESWTACQQFIIGSMASSPVVFALNQWAEEHLLLMRMMKAESLPISSDSIESLFGVGKNRGTGEVKDPNRIGLRLPVFCGKVTEQDAHQVLEITLAEQKNVTDRLPSLLKQRCSVLNTPGRLDTLAVSKATRTLELLPAESKSQSKILDISTIQIDCVKTEGPHMVSNIDPASYLRKQNLL